MGIKEISGKIKELRELKRMAEEIAAEIDAIQDVLKADMLAKGVDVLSGVDYKVSFTEVTTRRLDTTALRKALPDVAERFTKETKTRRFTVA